MSGERRGGIERKKEWLRALLHLAAQDTEAAKLLAEHGNHYATYHCQQAAEKLIAFCCSTTTSSRASITISTSWSPSCRRRAVEAKLAPLHKYTPYATTYRYATPGGRVPTSPEAGGVATDAAHISAMIADAKATCGRLKRGSGPT